MQDIAHEYTATSFDDAWLDDMTFWSLAEMNTILEIINAINTAHLSSGQSYWMQIQAASEDGLQPASITLSAREDSGPHPFTLQHLADCLCRLIRPARYDLAETYDSEDDDREVWTNVFRTQQVSAHEKLRISCAIPGLAQALGRTEYGIAAALDELLGWPDERTPNVALSA